MTGRNPPPPGESSLIRALDASANRAREALRVVEDHARFVLDDAHLTEQLKRLRHDLATATAGVDPSARLACRETQADVGTQVTLPSEAARPTTASVVAANWSRFSEAIRSLEEFAKRIDPTMAAACETLRYRGYTLERALGLVAQSLNQLADARLYVLMDGQADEATFVDGVTRLVAAGVDIIQLRDKQLNDRTLVQRARALVAATRGTATRAIINDRPDIAWLAGADGVHVGQDELSVKDARSLLGPEAWIGVSTHSVDQAERAELDGATYVGVGPVFPSATKAFDRFVGLELVGQVAQRIRLPAFCIGGIHAQNLPEVLAAGGRRIAVSSAVWQAAQPDQAARQLKQQILSYAGG